MRLGTEVTALDPMAKVATLSDGNALGYRVLI